MKIVQRTLRDPLDAFQVGREVKEIKDLLMAVQLYSGKGSPEGIVAANIGSLYTRTDGSAGTTLYVKESGNSTVTGWVAK